jgi:hypothetical protein
MTWQDGWPICDADDCGPIRYEGVFRVDGKDYCIWHKPEEEE